MRCFWWASRKWLWGSEHTWVYSVCWQTSGVKEPVGGVLWCFGNYSAKHILVHVCSDFFCFFLKSFPLCCTSCQIEVLLLQRTMALSAWLSVHPVFLNSMLIMFTTCQGRQDMIQISAFMLYDAWDVAEEAFSAGALMTGKAQNQMLGAIFRPEPSQAKRSTSLHQPPASQRKVFVLFPPPPRCSKRSHHSACFLKFSVSHHSCWMEPRPLAASPAGERYCRSKWPKLWQPASHLTPVSFTSAPGPMGGWFERMRAWAHMACV